MGGGDLNMKKSWHPGLAVNQEKVWQREKEASEERKKLEELRREREQEREMQELQRLQEEAGGKKRIDKVDWMYATPAANAGPSSSEMEDYLLGKKRVDKLLKADDAPIASSSSERTSLISLQNANSARDLAAKIREDPMLSIKQQEQAAYEALLRDPVRLRQLKLNAGINDDAKGETKEERRRRREERRLRHEKDQRRYRRSSVDADESYSDRRYSERDRHSDDRHHRSSRKNETWRSRDLPRRSPSQERSVHRHTEAERHSSSKKRYEDSDDRRRYRERSRSPPRTHRIEDKYDRKAIPRKEPHTTFPSTQDQNSKEAEREARLKEMMQNAASMQQERSSFVSKINTEEAVRERHEHELREKLLNARRKGQSDGKGAFLQDQQRKMYGDGVDLAERIRRGRGGYQGIDT